MKIQKRDGSFVVMKFDKITQRLKNLMTTEMKRAIDVELISQKVIDSLYDGIQSTEIDALVAETAVGMSTIQTEYEDLAARVVASSIRKQIPMTFSDAMWKLREAEIISEDLWNSIETIGRSTVNEAIVHARDMQINFFGLKTLEKSYLQRLGGKLMESPQYLWMRVSLGIHGDDWERAKETYELMSQGYFTHATPTLFNAGTPKPQMSSCFLVAMKDDSIDGIYKTAHECAQISKWAGGIGMHIHNVRGDGSHIKGTNGTSSGIIPMLRVFNATARYVNQAGRRKGSIAVYIEPWHSDIEAFLDLRLNQGDEEARCRDLFSALWIPDLFMERVQDGGKWSLFSPDDTKDLPELYGNAFKEAYERYEQEGKAVKTMDAHSLWQRILRSQVETGTPYMLFKDPCNEKSNQKNLGTIKCSNLCVAPETMILTDQGYFPIQELVDQNVNVWNGKEFSKTTVRQTGKSQPLITVKTSYGKELRCTPYHKFWIHGMDEPVRACDLKLGMKIIKTSFPTINCSQDEMKYAYTHGLFCADGTTSSHGVAKRCCFRAVNNGLCKRHQRNIKQHPHDGMCQANSFTEQKWLDLYDTKKELLKFVDYDYANSSSNKIRCALPKDIQEKFFVPHNYSLSSKLKWLAGLLDGDGCATRHVGGRGISLQIASIHKNFLTEIGLMLQTMGVQSRLNKLRDETTRSMPGGTYTCKETWRLLISSGYVEHLKLIGLKLNRINIETENQPNRMALHFETISGVEDFGDVDDTYCFNEPKRHMGIFNGILTGQCTEIVEYTDKDETAVCNLASIALPKFVNPKTKKFNYQSLIDVSRTVTRNLNKVIDRNFYPTEPARKSNMRHRPIGIGVQGLADTYILMDMAFDSEEARELNHKIFEAIYYGSVMESMEEAKKYGAYETFEGSPASKGILQFDMWEPSKYPLNQNWDELKEKVKKHGMRNSLLLAPMPTASTSQILGNNECIEPYTSNMYLRRTLAGEFVVINKHLIKELISLGIWNNDTKNAIIRDNGSVQNLTIPDELKAKYKTVWEMSQKTLIDQAADRGRFVCQSQSLNLFLEDPNTSRISSMHMYAWKQGLKTGMYYLRTRPKARAVQFTVDPVAKAACSIENKDDCVMCSA
jgi:ribonucleoside-diphosphate reductase alpha chain